MSTKSRISIVLADDHQIIRQSLRVLLENEPDFEIVGEAGNGLEALSLIEKKNPTVAVMDLMMPNLNGLELLRSLRKTEVQTRVVILSMHGNAGYVVEALRQGAAGYVLKQSTANHLIQAVRTVAAGGRYLAPPLSEREIQDFVLKTGGTLDLQRESALTLRESEVMDLVADGLTSAQIAERLKISSRTVEHHRANVMRKLNCRSQTDLIRHALLARTANPRNRA